MNNIQQERKFKPGDYVAYDLGNEYTYEPDGVITSVTERGTVFVQWLDFPDYSLFDNAWEHAETELVLVTRSEDAS